LCFCYWLLNVFQDFNEYVAVKMRVYIFQIAIIGQCADIFKLILKETIDKFGGRRVAQVPVL